MRKSGEPYIIHPLCVAIILADLELDKETIAAGLLHDVVEDTIITDEEIAAEFGDDVALLVDGVTKLGKLQYKEKIFPCHFIWFFCCIFLYWLPRNLNIWRLHLPIKCPYNR